MPLKFREGGVTKTAPIVTTVSEIYAIGATGPAGGFIFYDAGSWTGAHGGWRYLEALPYDVIGTESTFGGMSAEWGGAEWYPAVGVVDHNAIGAGKANTAKIVSVYGGRDPCNYRRNYAAAICYGLSYGGYSDWVLPSKDELNQLYLNRTSLDDYEPNHYWSSSEHGEDWYIEVWEQNFNTGNQNYTSKYMANRLRPVRRF